MASRGLSPAHLEGIARLEEECVGDGRLKLEWSTLRTRDPSQVRDHLFVADDQLVGFLGVYRFGGGPIELCGMVHPQYRRQGIMTRLLASAAAEELPGDELGRLLVVDQASTSGRDFAVAKGARLENCEYGMELRHEPEPGAFDRFRDLGRRLAGAEDAAVLTTVLRSAFAADLAAWSVPQDGSQFFAITWEGAVIGGIRTEIENGAASISGFAILAQHRGRGFGHQVLASVVQELLDQGAARITLDVATDNERALGLYRHVGFEQAGALDYYRLP